MPTNTKTNVFQQLEDQLIELESKTWTFWLTAYEACEAWIADAAEGEKRTTSAFAEAWNKQFRTRSVATIKQQISLVRGVVAKGYDTDSVEDLEHAKQIMGRGGKGATKPEPVTVERVAELANKLSTAEARKLVRLLAEQLHMTVK